VPTNTPRSIKLIAENHCVKVSISLPSTLESRRSSKDSEIRKASVHIHKSFVKFIASPKEHSFGGLFNNYGD